MFCFFLGGYKSEFQQHFNPHLTERLFQQFYNIHGWEIFLDEKKQDSVKRELSGILLALFLSSANRSTFLAPLPFCVSLALLATTSFRPLFFYLIFPLPFFIIFWSSVCSCCRRDTVFFYPFFCGVECDKIFPYFGFFCSQGFFLLFAWSFRHQLLLSLLSLHVWISFSLCLCCKTRKSEVWTTFVCWAKGKLGFTIPCKCGCYGLWN